MRRHHASGWRPGPSIADARYTGRPPPPVSCERARLVVGALNNPGWISMATRRQIDSIEPCLNSTLTADVDVQIFGGKNATPFHFRKPSGGACAQCRSLGTLSGEGLPAFARESARVHAPGLVLDFFSRTQFATACPVVVAVIGYRGVIGAPSQPRHHRSPPSAQKWCPFFPGHFHSSPFSGPHQQATPTPGHLNTGATVIMGTVLRAHVLLAGGFRAQRADRITRLPSKSGELKELFRERYGIEKLSALRLLGVRSSVARTLYIRPGLRNDAIRRTVAGLAGRRGLRGFAGSAARALNTLKRARCCRPRVRNPELRMALVIFCSVRPLCHWSHARNWHQLVPLSIFPWK